MECLFWSDMLILINSLLGAYSLSGLSHHWVVITVMCDKQNAVTQRSPTQHNKIQHNTTQHNATQRNTTPHNMT